MELNIIEKYVNWAILRYTINAKNICCIGAVFDFFSDTQKHAGKFWIKANLEWLQRFLNNYTI